KLAGYAANRQQIAARAGDASMACPSTSLRGAARTGGYRCAGILGGKKGRDGARGRLCSSYSVPESWLIAFCRGGPMSTGWNSTAAAIVHRRDSAINLPMLAVPGWRDSHSPPNAVAVVRALKT